MWYLNVKIYLSDPILGLVDFFVEIYDVKQISINYLYLSSLLKINLFYL